MEKEIVFSDVAQKIKISSLLVQDLNIVEFNYDYGLVDKNKLLEKYIDRNVYLKDKKSGERKSCRLISAEKMNELVLEDNETKEIYLNTDAELILPSLPPGLMVRPALICNIVPTIIDNIKISYLCDGFKWVTNYVIELLEETLNIAGWAEITNKSGNTFENARIKLIAGDVSVDYKYMHFEEEPLCCEDSLMYSKKLQSEQAEEKNFFDYHIYTFSNKTTVKDNQTKQINILNGSNVAYTKYYSLNERSKNANIVIEFVNKRENGLGITLPKGSVKLYKLDEYDKSLEFIGEDNIKHIAENEEVKFIIGNAFDITFDFNEVECKKIKGYTYYKYEATIKNHTAEKIEARFKKEICGVWEMVSSSHDYIKKSSAVIEFHVNIIAKSEVKICFEYKIKHRIELFIEKLKERFG